MADILISNEQQKFSPLHVTTILQPVNNSNDLTESFDKEVGKNDKVITIFNTISSCK